MDIFTCDSKYEIDVYCCMYSNCGNEYSSKYNLKRHVDSVHLNIKKFLCSICKTSFSSKQSLREHYYKHKGLMPFFCVTCSKSFRQASLLSLHIRIHNSEGTSSVISRSDPDDSDFNYQKIDKKTANVEISLPGIAEDRRGVKELPSLFF